ncbi:MAG: hypothetical protein CVV46_07455 [Spirochaetae bacterium HGW-Spirochaetae-2]|nr:MAG: hypothetical protein CVV46_07455 [Spirochaetae bacterium HGW-Spirochaetae-2]
MRPDRFVDKVAFITGGGQGMGQQLAIDMAKEGARVVVVDIDVQGLEETRTLLEEQNSDYLIIECDISDDVQVAKAIGKTIGKYSRLDILVNNAGLLRNATIEETTNDLIDKTIDINIKGILYAIREVTPIMKRQSYGRIVNVSSITGYLQRDRPTCSHDKDDVLLGRCEERCDGREDSSEATWYCEGHVQSDDVLILG